MALTFEDILADLEKRNFPDDGERALTFEEFEEVEAKKKRDARFRPKTIFDFKGLIDAGYLSFVHGSRKGGAFGGWDQARWNYVRYLLVMDSANSVRRDYFPDYKIRRAERRKKNPYQQQVYEQVVAFREVMRQDTVVYSTELDGYEADDVVAYCFIKGIGRENVIGQDKDLFMVPGLQAVMRDHTGTRVTRNLKLPKYAITPHSPGSYTLTQAIYGDKSDSIPRLLPSSGAAAKRLYAHLIRKAKTLELAYHNCYSYFGDEFVTNLLLVTIPHPSLANTLDITSIEAGPRYFFHVLSTGEYWHPDFYSNHYIYILEDVLWQTLNW